jgi:hypothetical protein
LFIRSGNTGNTVFKGDSAYDDTKRSYWFSENFARIASMTNTPYRYKNRAAKDRKILVGLAELSMPERYKRLQRLEFEIQKMEKSLANKRSGSQTEKQRRAVLADGDGLIELKCRLALERSEYLTRKEITPDFEEPAGAKRF